MDALEGKVRVPQDVAHRQVGDETVLLNLRTGTYFGLNEVGSRYWQALVDQGDLRSAFNRMIEEYEVTPERLEADLLRVTNELVSKGLIEIVS
jgi:hypothetical protein